MPTYFPTDYLPGRAPPARPPSTPPARQQRRLRLSRVARTQAPALAPTPNPSSRQARGWVRPPLPTVARCRLPSLLRPGRGLQACMCTDCELHVHWICSACALIVYCMGTAYAPIANSVCTACALHETLYSPLLLLLLLLLEHYLPASDASALHWWDLPMPHLLLPHLPWQDPTPQVRAWPRCDPAPRDVERLALFGQGASPPRPQVLVHIACASGRFDA